jgi:hypothetical protein
MNNTANVANIPIWQNISLEDLPNEIWIPIKGYEGMYQISTLGRVKSLKRVIKTSIGVLRPLKAKILRLLNENHNYLTVTLSKNGTSKIFRVHQLIAITFLKHKPNGHALVVDHIDNNKLNNNLENIQVITTRQNISKDMRGCSSKYTGVCWHKINEKWESKITINKKRKFLGYFFSEIEASKAYQKALKEINS